MNSARATRVRAAPTQPRPSLAAAVHRALLGEDDGEARFGGTVRRRVIKMCGGALIVCQTRGGACVLATCDGAGCAADGGMSLYLRVRAKRDFSALWQYPPPPRTAHAGSNGRAATAATCAASASASPIPGAASHDVPPGKTKLLAMHVSVGASERCGHWLEVCAEQRRRDACELCGGKTGRGGGGAMAGSGSGSGSGSDDDDDDDDVRIVDANATANATATATANAGIASVFAEEFPDLPPPPPGTTDEELAAILAAAIARAAAEEAETGGGGDDDDVVVTGVVPGGGGGAASWRRVKEEENLKKQARAPPRRLRELFTAQDACAWARGAARRGGVV